MLVNDEGGASMFRGGGTPFSSMFVGLWTVMVWRYRLLPSLIVADETGCDDGEEVV